MHLSPAADKRHRPIGFAVEGLRPAPYATCNGGIRAQSLPRFLTPDRRRVKSSFLFLRIGFSGRRLTAITAPENDLDLRAPTKGADQLLRTKFEIEVAWGFPLARERLCPQFQHSVNWPSTSSPQPAQCQGFLTDSRGARVFLRIDFARASFSSFVIQSSGQHSIGGNSPAALERSRFLVTQWMPNVARTFFK